MPWSLPANSPPKLVLLTLCTVMLPEGAALCSTWESPLLLYPACAFISR